MIIWNLNQILFPALGETVADTDEKTLESIWKELGDSSPRKALKAVEQFAIHGEQSAAHFESRIMAMTNIVDQSKIGLYISQLNDKRFDVRDKATDSLMKLRNVAEVQLRKALQEPQAVETRYRLELIIKTPFEKPKIDAPDYRRLQRLIHALELTDDAKASKLLESLAKGHPHIDVAREALDSHRRQVARSANAQ